MPFRLVCPALLILIAVAPVRAQSKAPAPAGLETAWDVRTVIATLQHDVSEIEPLLAEMNPQNWVDSKGAPSTYIVQWQSTQQQVRDLSTMLRTFAQRTESLPTGLDVYFRLEAIETVERACEQGARLYDSRANADKLSGMIARNFDNRQRLREYLKNLAASSEANFKIADEEAQRCRATLSKQPLGRSSGRRP